MTNFNNKTMNTFQNMMNMNNVLHLFVNEQDEYKSQCNEHQQLATTQWTFATNITR